MNTNAKKTKCWAAKKTAVVCLTLLGPVLMGGCPEFRNQSVDAFETASRGVLDAALDLFFDQFRSNEIS